MCSSLNGKFKRHFKDPDKHEASCGTPAHPAVNSFRTAGLRFSALGKRDWPKIHHLLSSRKSITTKMTLLAFSILVLFVNPVGGHAHYRRNFAYLDEFVVNDCVPIELDGGGGAACALGQILDSGEQGVGLVRYETGTVYEECQGDTTPKYCCPARVPMDAIPSEIGGCRRLETVGGIGPCTCGEESASGGWAYFDRRPAVRRGETTVVCCDE